MNLCQTVKQATRGDTKRLEYSSEQTKRLRETNKRAVATPFRSSSVGVADFSAFGDGGFVAKS